ncbi:MAG: peptide deformylase [Holosporales bacterium]|jgi:peptide deformylase|nr:peptide deformylase [Holosporales bacterium]
MKVRIYPDPVLKKKALPVADIDQEILSVLEQMKNVMIQGDGIGLAAPQVGIDKRLIVINNEVIIKVMSDALDSDDIADKQEVFVYKMINPEITWRSEERSIGNEGCLSLPGSYCDVERASSVSVRFLDERGETQNITTTKLLAVCVQHEIDHLDGILFIDRISNLKRRLLLDKYKKQNNGLRQGVVKLL